MKQALWDRFCNQHEVLRDCVPLFEVDHDQNVQVKRIGKVEKQILLRSAQCESLILSVVDTLVPGWTSGTKNFDGMLYMMGWKQDDSFLPLYIGKTESPWLRLQSLPAY